VWDRVSNCQTTIGLRLDWRGLVAVNITFVCNLPSQAKRIALYYGLSHGSP